MMTQAPTRLKPLAASIRLILAGACLSGAARAGDLPVPQPNFATVGRADQSVAGNKMTINQYTDRAVLNWQSFNIGQDGAVQFKQPGASAIALNRIAQNDPSRILGKLSANGQVYLLNQNGFVFGKDSRVDVNTLVASTLDISDDTFQRGITKVLGQDGRPALVGKGEVYRRDANGNFILDGQGQKTKIGINIEKGAEIKAAKSGRIIAAAPSVTNGGDLTAPDGQILLVAATDKVYLQEAGSDAKLRGLVVEVGTGGDVNNVGKILAERGNATLMGFAVNQDGRVTATTSVRANGSVRLLAREGGSVRREGDQWLLQPGTTKRLADQGDGLGTRATVTLGKGSATEASPDLNDSATAVDGQTQDVSWMEVSGQQIRVEDGASLRSRSGQISLKATENPANPGLDNVKNDSRVYIAKGATLDVSGVEKVSLPVERNVVTVELRSNELRDSPLQRKGVLYGQKVKVDIRKGTPIADITGELERIERTVAERSTTGGTLDLVSEGDAVVRPGAVLNFSGGSVFYRPGYIDTTQLVGADGKTYDIGSADPNRHYAGILGKITEHFPTANLTKTYDMLGPTQQGRFEQGYVEGKSAGALSVKAAALDLEGEMRGTAVAGPRQRTPEAQPAGGHLSIDLARTPTSTQAVDFRKTPSSLSIGAEGAFPDDPENPGQPATLALSGDQLRKSGLMTAAITTNGKIAIRAGETVQLPGGGSLSLTGGEINLDGDISARSGQVKLTTRLTSATLGKLSGVVNIGPSAHIDASGGWVNDRPADSTGGNRLDLGSILTHGGSVTVSAQGDVNLSAGGVIDVSGGARRTLKRKIEAGDAGAIKLEAAGIDGSDLAVNGTVSGYAVAGGRGGALSLVSDQIVLGDAPASLEGGARPLVIDPKFFNLGGFAHYSLASNKSGVSVSDGAEITLSVRNRILDLGLEDQASGADLRDFSHIGLLPEATRQAAQLDLTLAQRVGQGGRDAAVTLGQGARIATDAGGVFKFASDTSIFINGTLDAPAGSVALTVTPPVGAEPGFLPDQGIWLGSGASLDVAGAALLRNDKLGQTVGEVLPGGAIALHADRGFIVAEPGSRLDVSGTAAALDLPKAGPNGALATERRTVASAGGKLDLRAAEGVQLYADLHGQPGSGTGAAGGELSLELNPRTRSEPDEIVPGQLPFPKVPSVIAVSQASGLAETPVQGEAVPAGQYGQAIVDADRVDSGGFSALTLRTPDKIEFTGDVSLKAERSLVLDAPVLAFKPAGETSAGTVSAKAAYIALGSSQTRPGAAAPSSGGGGLEVSGGTVDLIGTAALQGFGAASVASAGDLRLIGVRTSQQQRDFLGEFLVAGDITLKADQLYPSTLSDFRVAVQGNADGVLSVEPGDGAGSTVLSAGGKLTLEAPNIVQGGTLKAPLGEINLKATDSLRLTDGSLTSNSAQGAVIPFGRTQGGLDWIYPLGEQNLVYTAPPEKKLALQGQAVQLESGAVVDTSGGGDLYAFEFVPGPGGSADLLDPANARYQETYAVLPELKNGVAPYDPLEFPGAGLQVGDSVHLAGGGGLKTGTYTLLPAHYALLPGAYLVTPEANTTDLVPGQGLKRGDGAPIVAGYRRVANTDIRAARWSGFAVEKGDAARLRAEYSGHRANEFFAAKAQEQERPAPYLPQDAGALLIAAQTGLNLDGRVTAKPADGGRGGRLDLDAANIAIVQNAPADGALSGAEGGGAGVVTLTADSLNGLGVSSIAIGGVRSAGDGVTVVKTDASTIRLESGAKLVGSEFILTAKQDISLADGTGVIAGGEAEASATQTVYSVDGDAAFLRASSSGQADLKRSGVSGKTGSINIGAGATVSASGSMIVDATADTRLEGTLETQGGSVALGASRISLGEVTGATGGLALNSAELAGLAVNELILSSGGDISLFGAVDLAPKNLVLRSGALLGFANNGRTANIKADAVRIENPLAASSDRQADGTGGLAVSAKSVVFGEGDYRLQGFTSAGFEASGAMSGDGAGQLTARADVSLKAGRVTGGKGAATAIDATGHHVTLQSVANADPATGPEALGGQWSITADGIRQAGTISAPSGVVRLNALTGDVLLASGSNIDVSGRVLNFGGPALDSDGGAIQLSAQSGNVILESGANLKLSGQQGGSLSVAAPNGNFSLAGTADAKGGTRGGRFDLDTGSLPNGGELGGLGATLAAAGFSDEIQLRARTGDVSLSAGNTLEARSIEVTADQGKLTIAGTLNAQGAGAAVDLRSGGELRLSGTANLQAQGTPDQGGKISLDAADSPAGIVLDSGATLDLRAADGAANGTLSLRAARTSNDVAVSGDLKSAVTGAKETTVEAVRVYTGKGTITASDTATWKADTDAYMANAAAIETRLGLPGGLRPGLEIRSPGDLILTASGWDLVDWRYDGRPGVLTLKAGRDLAINGKLSDGFRDDPNGIDLASLLGTGRTMPVKDMLQTGQSWSYRLEAGEDITVGSGVAVRTGTGDIRVTAGEDVALTDAGSAIYTAGRPTDSQRYGGFKPGFVAFQFYGEYPVEGGDIAISAGRDVIGAPTGQFFDGWLVRTGNWTQNADHTGETPTAWAVAIGGPTGSGQPSGDFRQNIGALGGGNVTVNAGRDVAALSVVIPTTGKQTGQVAKPDNASDTGFLSNEITVSGGGNLAVAAGGDVIGGTFYTGRGTGGITAAGSITGVGSPGGLGVVLGLGDASFSLQAGHDISLGAALNPTVINSARARDFFFTYSADSGVSLRALSGDVELQNNIGGLIDTLNSLRTTSAQLTFPGATQSALSVYPASLDVAALQGSVVFDRSLVTYPAATARFNLLAGVDVTTGQVGDNVNITMSDADPSLLPSAAFPATSWEDAAQRLQPFGDANLIHAQTPVHRGDTDPARIHAAGNIVSADPLLFSLPKAVEARAGKDLLDVSFQVQHPDYALSSFAAGRDVRFTSPRNAQGNLVNLTREIQVSGPGQVWVTAGRTIDLGASEGIYTIGNTSNRALAEDGASVSILAGMGDVAHFDEFAQKYDPLSEKYAGLLTDYMRKRTGDGTLDVASAATAYQALPEAQRREFLLAMFFGEIRAAASLAARTGEASAYDAGFAAIEALFPGAGEKESRYRGDLKLFFSKVHTVDGGDINLLVPGGDVNAGLAVAFAGSKPASDLGIVAQRSGAVNALVDGDFLVNQSRVFAMDGGDITLWSSNGNIDAGRGAKSAIAAPPPIISFDELGNLKVEFPPVVSGSGIRTAASTAPQPGDVFLAAPRGVVDAGEAGIGGNNITIAATAVIGASNIDVGGSSAGVPSANVAVPVAPAGAASAAAAATQNAQQTASNNNDGEQADKRKQLADAARLTPLNVEVLGFGECSPADVKNGAPGCG
ncbi:filamentous haemagglutinin family protein [Methylomagnum sp.]